MLSEFRVGQSLEEIFTNRKNFFKTFTFSCRMDKAPSLPSRNGCAAAVGRILEISAGTVRIHRRNIYSKLRIRSQGELFSRFITTLLDSSP